MTILEVYRYGMNLQTRDHLTGSVVLYFRMHPVAPQLQTTIFVLVAFLVVDFWHQQRLFLVYCNTYSRGCHQFCIDSLHSSRGDQLLCFHLYLGLDY